MTGNRRKGWNGHSHWCHSQPECEEQEEHPFLFSHSHHVLGSQDGTGGSFSSQDPRSLHKR